MNKNDYEYDSLKSEKNTIQSLTVVNIIIFFVWIMLSLHFLELYTENKIGIKLNKKKIEYFEKRLELE